LFVVCQSQANTRSQSNQDSWNIKLSAITTNYLGPVPQLNHHINKALHYPWGHWPLSKTLQWVMPCY